MNSIIILSACIALCSAGGNQYSFGYTTADGQSRQETGHGGGAVTGAYSYVDANGDVRQVRYVADANGYRAEGDVSVDRRTAAAAAALEAIAPKAAVAVAPAPVHYAAAPGWGNWGAPAHYAASPYAAPIAHQLAAPIAPWAVHGIRGYSVQTPTHSINFQI